MNCIYKELANQFFLGKTYIAENLGFEYLRDMYADIRHYSVKMYKDCLTQVAKMKQSENKYPNWINRHIQKRENIEIVDQTQPQFNGMVFVGNLNHKKNVWLFGFGFTQAPFDDSS